MPAGRFDQSLYVGSQGGVEQMNVTTLYKLGELGKQIQIGNKAYQLVQVDSGATASTGAGHAPQCGDVAFWKDRKNYLVTNDKVQVDVAESGGVGQANGVAGVFCSLKTTGQAGGDTSITPGNYGFVQQRGRHVGILNTSGGAVKGDYLVSTTVATSATPTTTKLSTGATLTANQIVAIATNSTSAVTTNYTPAILGGGDIVDQP